MKPIKYLDYTVYQNNEIVKTGTVPEIFSLSGIEKQFNIGGVWIWHTCPVEVNLQLTNGDIVVNNYSDRSPDNWFQYCESHGLAIANPHNHP